MSSDHTYMHPEETATVSACCVQLTAGKNLNDIYFIFLPGSNSPLTFCWSAHRERIHKGTLESCALRMRAHLSLMLLGVRLNIEVGGFHCLPAGIPN